MTNRSFGTLGTVVLTAIVNISATIKVNTNQGGFDQFFGGPFDDFFRDFFKNFPKPDSKAHIIAMEP
jgi:hypothetical protein